MPQRGHASDVNCINDASDRQPSAGRSPWMYRMPGAGGTRAGVRLYGVVSDLRPPRAVELLFRRALPSCARLDGTRLDALHRRGRRLLPMGALQPTTPGYRKSPLQGAAYLCTPKGEKFRLHFGGGMPANHGTDLRGLPIHLYLSNWALGAQFRGDRRPQLDLYGTFGDSQLILEDRGSLARAFRPDGTLHEPRDRNRTWQQESAHVTLQEDSSWVSSTSCPATPK